MSVNVKVGEPVKSDKPFPKLMKGIGNQIVLFTEPRKGTCIHCGNIYCAVGLYSEDWPMSTFTDFNDSVELQNS